LGNTYFQFKQFIIHHDQSAMKVSTDACLFGAVIPVNGNDSVLDIGTGTGLLALMLAQKCDCEIDAVELDAPSYRQAAANVSMSPWSSRIKVHHADIRLFHPGKKYSLIICNPPFFENHRRSSIAQQNTAKHADQLSFRELIEAVSKNLKSDGLFAVLLPANIIEKFVMLSAMSSLHVLYHVYISDREILQPKRVITIFSPEIQETKESNSIYIKDAGGNYSKQFRELLEPYYLHL
jgi:tRNA1Val (adenine37-N6)-methyltransferase